MAGPFIYIGTYTLKPGKLDQARESLGDLVALVEANEPRVIAFNVYFDDEGTVASVVQVHPDSTSMEHHMTVISDHLADAFDYLDETVSEQAYGRPSPELAAVLDKFADEGAATTRRPAHHAGFVRTSVG